MRAENLESCLSAMDAFAVIWHGHFGVSLHVFRMNEIAEKRKARAGGVYGAMYESFYDLTEGLSPILSVKGSYDWSDEDWLDGLRKVGFMAHGDRERK